MLGTRRFSLDPATSGFAFVLPAFVFAYSGFQGFFDLTAGTPNMVTGEAQIDVTGASEYLYIDLNPNAQIAICLRPVSLPVLRAGIIDCTGGQDLGVSVDLDHHIGETGIGGFSEEDCAATGGTIEGTQLPHPNVCNGPLVIGSSGEDSGAGAVKIGFDVSRGLNGIPVELTVESALPCGDEGTGVMTAFGLVSGRATSTIRDRDNMPDATLFHEERGKNFSCHRWSQENSTGGLVAVLPALHGFAGFDLINVFVWQD